MKRLHDFLYFSLTQAGDTAVGSSASRLCLHHLAHPPPRSEASLRDRSYVRMMMMEVRSCVCGGGCGRGVCLSLSGLSVSLVRGRGVCLSSCEKNCVKNSRVLPSRENFAVKNWRGIEYKEAIHTAPAHWLSRPAPALCAHHNSILSAGLPSTACINMSLASSSNALYLNLCTKRITMMSVTTYMSLGSNLDPNLQLTQFWSATG